MSDRGLKMRKSGPKNRSFTAANRLVNSYNASSLAVDAETEESHVLYLVPIQKPRHAPPSVPAFLGLDAALEQRSPKSRLISAIVHLCLSALVLWLGMKVRPVIAPPITATRVDFKLFAPSPPPPKILPVAKESHGGGGGG